jgi:hypothetical protein
VVSELPAHISKTIELSEAVLKKDLGIFWRSMAEDLPALCRIAMLYQPSSAAAERVFSLLKSQFGKRQQSSLEDYVSTSIKL